MSSIILEKKIRLSWEFITRFISTCPILSAQAHKLETQNLHFYTRVKQSNDGLSLGWA
jgi:hypothetical protein